MQTDPLGYGDGMNMYRYVGNDPVNGVDPTGMICWDLTGQGFWTGIADASACYNWGAYTGHNLVWDPDAIYVWGNDDFMGPQGVPAGLYDECTLYGYCGGGWGWNDGAAGPVAGPLDPQPAEPLEEQTQYCQEVHNSASEARGQLSGRITQDKVWNDVAALTFYKLRYQDNAFDGYWGVGYLAADIAGGFASAFGTPYAGVAAWTATKGGGEIIGNYYDEQAALVQARLTEIQRVRDGSCPAVAQ